MLWDVTGGPGLERQVWERPCRERLWAVESVEEGGRQARGHISVSESSRELPHRGGKELTKNR